jgi:ABC-type Fe3+/spermidine/putrescine transport system ATPase subunit
MSKIVLGNVTKVFQGPKGRAVHALDDISLEISGGEFIVLLGPSGCGKTTLLRCIAGLERPTSGTIAVDDRVVFSSADGIDVPPDKRALGMVFQSYALWPHMTVGDNVAYPLKRRGLRKNAREAVLEALSTVDCRHLVDRYPNEVSGGQQQRVSLARALVGSPAVLLFDEPLSNLDAGLRDRMRSEIKLLQSRAGCTSVYVTHDQREALALADRLVVMQGGSVQQVGRAEEVYDEPRTAFVADFLGAANLIPVVRHLGGNTYQTELGDITVRSTPASAGERQTIAVRQESFEVVNGQDPPADHNVLVARAATVEFLGDHRLATFDAGPGVSLRVRLSVNQRVNAGDTCRLAFAPSAATVVVAT